MTTEPDRIGQNDGVSQLTARQAKFLPILLANVNYTEACKAGRVSRDTLHRWLENPAFKAELDRQRDELVAQAFALLSQSVAKAVEKLVGLLDAGDGRLRRAGRPRHPGSAHQIPGTARTRKADRGN